ncbi:MAG TPA: tRNA (adenosine(37)-N6)-dimethylallyltransferase MiaA [Gammaproteobacteria bacterium]|nr:tRNA (adenosine(37)-N6)-dimethylallyltransferase MiaA [Gammaproteobacteria bacterium]
MSADTAAKPAAIFLMGPTASGKTDLAIELARRLPCDIISVDSAMVYRGMDIGTAKPDAATLAEAPHRLIDICDPAEAFSAAQFRERALTEIDAILVRGRIPLLVGGTMLYFRALEQGLSPLPSADPGVRAGLAAEAAAQGWPALHARLATVDPRAAARIEASDPQRILRALEVFELSGEPLSAWFEKPLDNALPFHPVKLVLAPSDRTVLHERIARRFRWMLDAGLLDEVRCLRERDDLHADLPAMRAVGYRQAWSYLIGDMDYDALLERGVIATRQLAKRQFTWLRKEQNAAWFEPRDEELLGKVLKYLQPGTTSRA